MYFLDVRDFNWFVFYLPAVLGCLAVFVDLALEYLFSCGIGPLKAAATAVGGYYTALLGLSVVSWVGLGIVWLVTGWSQ